MTWSDRVSALWAILGDRPVGYHPMLARAVGGAKAGLFLTQLLYWDGKGTLRPGWIVKTQREFEHETALTRYEMETARKRLKKAGVLEWEVRGVPARTHYRILYEPLLELLVQFVENQQTEVVETPKPEEAEPPSQDVEEPQTITESTQEITLESTPETSDAETASHPSKLDEAFPEQAQAKEESPEWQSPQDFSDLTDDEKAEIGAPGSAGDPETKRDWSGLHAFDEWSDACYRIQYPHGLNWQDIFDFGCEFSRLFHIPMPTNRNVIGLWRKGIVGCLLGFADAAYTAQEEGQAPWPQEILRRAKWGLQVLHARRELGQDYLFTIVSPMSLEKTLRVIAGELRQMEEYWALTTRLPNSEEALTWYNSRPMAMAKQRQQATGASTTEQTLLGLQEEHGELLETP